MTDVCGEIIKDRSLLLTHTCGGVESLGLISLALAHNNGSEETQNWEKPRLLFLTPFPCKSLRPTVPRVEVALRERVISLLPVSCAEILAQSLPKENTAEDR